MDEGAARKLAEQWRRLPGAENADAYHEHLVHALGGLFPNQLRTAAAVSGPDGPMILVLGERLLFGATPQEVETEGETGVDLAVVALDLAEVRVAVTESFVQAPGLIRRRRWCFSSREERISFTTEQTLRGAFHPEERIGTDERLAREVVERLGWPLSLPPEDA